MGKEIEKKVTDKDEEDFDLWDREDSLGHGTKKTEQEKNKIYGRAKDVFEMDLL